jgi:hypothetical protein
MPNPVQAAAEGLPEINRRRLLGGIVAASAASAVTGATAALAATTASAVAMTPRERAIWHMRELERLAKEDGAREAMVVVVGRFYRPDFHVKTLMIEKSAKLEDFGDRDFFASEGGAA